MKKIRNSGLYILGIVLVLVNILYFVIPFKRGSIFWLSDGFVFVAIGLQILTHYLAYRNADTMKKKVYAEWLQYDFVLKEFSGIHIH
jgi:hypothetical protein